MGRFAVLVNRNAQGARPELIEWLRGELGADLLVTGSLDEARAAVVTVLEREYPLLCVGGGDGTFCQLARDLVALAPGRGPAVFPLRLGTGNAVADVSGAAPATREGLARDLARAAGQPRVEPLALLDVGGQLTHLTGLGLDAYWADDYRRIIKERLQRGRLRPLVEGAPGYLLTFASRTLPRLLVRPRIRLRAIAVEPAAVLDGDGRDADQVGEGGVLFDGEALMASASTIRSYSAGLTYFPFAEQLAGRFQVRIGTAGLVRGLLSLPALFAGTFRDRRWVRDFAATAIRFEVPTAVPWHMGGDVQPPATSITVRLCPHTIPVVRG